MNTEVQSKLNQCASCGKDVAASAKACPNCGAPQIDASASEKKILPAFLLCTFLWFVSAHRFYTGKTGTAILQIFTLGGLGIWVTIDWIMLICGAFTDSEGRKMKQWT